MSFVFLFEKYSDNSLAGISKIFKERPKDEDGPLPEKEAKKKDKKDKKNKKGAVVPATVSHATAELDRTSVEDDDRALAGLSPAAKLARQHTLRSKAEAELAKKDGQSIPGTGEPTWDNNTTTRTAGGGPPQLPSIESLTNLSSSIFSSPTPTPTPTSPGGTPSSLGPEVLRVQPRHTQTVHHAHAVNVNVAEHEYDSDADDSSASASEAEAEDEDLAVAMGQTRVSEDTTTTHDHERDEEFKARWGNTWIDRNAVPKKGILKRELRLGPLPLSLSQFYFGLFSAAFGPHDTGTSLSRIRSLDSVEPSCSPSVIADRRRRFIHGRSKLPPSIPVDRRQLLLRPHALAPNSQHWPPRVNSRPQQPFFNGRLRLILTHWNPLQSQLPTSRLTWIPICQSRSKHLRTFPFSSCYSAQTPGGQSKYDGSSAKATQLGA